MVSVKELAKSLGVSQRYINIRAKKEKWRHIKVDRRGKKLFFLDGLPVSIRNKYKAMMEAAMFRKKDNKFITMEFANISRDAARDGLLLDEDMYQDVKKGFEFFKSLSPLQRSICASFLLDVMIDMTKGIFSDHPNSKQLTTNEAMQYIFSKLYVINK